MALSGPFRPSVQTTTREPVAPRAGRGANWERGRRSSLMRSSSWACPARGRSVTSANRRNAPQPGRDVTKLCFSFRPTRGKALGLKRGDLHLGKRGEHVVDLARDRLQPFLARRLEPHHQDRLRVRRANQGPAIAELNPRAVDVDDGIEGGEVLPNLIHDSKFTLVGTVQPELGRGDVA